MPFPPRASPRPTPTDRDNAAAWLDYNARVHARGQAVLHAVLVVVLGVLGALALIHWATPCADAALCLAPLAWRTRWHAGLGTTAPRAWRNLCRRVRIHVLRVRLHQLLGTAQECALDLRPDATLRLGAVLARAAAVRLDLQRAERAHAQAQAGASGPRRG